MSHPIYGFQLGGKVYVCINLLRDTFAGMPDDLLDNALIHSGSGQL